MRVLASRHGVAPVSYLATANNLVWGQGPPLSLAKPRACGRKRQRAGRAPSKLEQGYQSSWIVGLGARVRLCNS